MQVCVCVFVCLCVCACVRACVRACVTRERMRTRHHSLLVRALQMPTGGIGGGGYRGYGGGDSYQGGGGGGYQSVAKDEL